MQIKTLLFFLNNIPSTPDQEVQEGEEQFGEEDDLATFYQSSQVEELGKSFPHQSPNLTYHSCYPSC